MIHRQNTYPYRQSYAQRPASARNGCLGAGIQAFVIAFVVTLAVVLLACAALMVGYVYIAMSLPAPEELSSRTATFASTQIYDRNGVLLYEILDPHGGRRTLVPLERISPYVIQATIATEDANFYKHPGVDPVGLIRAIVKDIKAGEVRMGGSTISQQLVKLIFLSPERTISRKIKEAVLAAEITRRYSKEQILEIYLNEIFYGNHAYGIEAAAQTYFGKPASELTLAEAALLAGIPQSPAIYDPFTNPEDTLWRRAQVLRLMVEQGYITQAQADAANREPLPKTMKPIDMKAPHFVVYVRQQLEARYGPEVLYKAGLRVHTSLDYRLQELAEQTVREHVATLKNRHVTNGALVAMQPATGEILAMVGSRGFFDPDIDGQVNVTIRLRQPGSAIKPITYLAAFEKGWTPATLIWDVETEFPDGANPPYRPVNYDGKFHGPVLVREALGSSYNVPAVKALQFVGLPDFLELCRRLGITTLSRPDYGLSLTLGGGEVTLLELTSAYGTLANGGRRVPPVTVLRIEDASGRVIEQYTPPAGEQVVSPQHAYLITHILADNEARRPAFGPNSPLRLSRPAAAKTGTSNDFRDNWTIGYTPSLVAGVWVGNNDNSPMQNVSGVTGATPIWHHFMEKALAGQPIEDFTRPPGIEEIEICADSGTRPSEACPRRRIELFAAGQGPLGPEADFHQLIAIDVSTNQLATEFCPPELVEKRPFEVYPPEGLEWARANNRPMPPTEYCSVHRYQARVEIFDPRPEQTLSGTVPIFGVVQVPDLDHFRVEYGEGPDPIGWGLVAGPFMNPVEGGLLAMWDTSSLKDMDYSLRVVAVDRHGHTQEARIHVWVENRHVIITVEPTATLSPMPLPTWTPTVEPATPTPTPVELIPSPTATPPAPTATPMPSPQPRIEALITWPADGAIVGGLVQIAGTAGGPGFAAYQLAYGAGFDPVEWTPILEATEPIREGQLGTWDTTPLAEGLYAIRLRVMDQAGATQEALVRVTTDNQPPFVEITRPAMGETLPAGQPVSLAARADDNLGIARVEFYLDGQLLGNVVAQPYEWLWAEPVEGEHRVYVLAYDLAGHMAQSAEVLFRVSGSNANR